MAGSVRRILISGAGIAGPALAWWLDRFGFEPVLVELAPKFRNGGYVVDFWGKGYDVAERMGLMPEIQRRGYHVREVRFVRRNGRRAGWFSTAPIAAATGGCYISLPRGDLAESIWDALPPAVETRFGDEISGLCQHDDHVAVRFANAPPERFDAVIGADGLHSRVRKLCFGAQDAFEHFLGYGFAAFTADGYQPREPDTYVTCGLPGRQASRFTMRGGRTLILFVWRESSKLVPGDDEAARALLRQRFGGVGWECPRMLAALDDASDLYLDSVSQIRMPGWSRGRIALVGDAAWAPSFLAGEGAGLAMIGAYVLAGELRRSGGDTSAFAACESRLRTLMESKQHMAARFARAFVPKTRLGILFRNLAVTSFNVPLIARLALAGSLSDPIDLLGYEDELRSAGA
jgi:2-polyprenyl-6-methoxyphenol hydroxylase-like FAD-dependent oxidoreductase